MFSQRELLYFLAWRDTKVRYKQTVLGAAWALLQPLLLMAVFTIVLGRLARVNTEGIPYPAYTYAALVPWTLFAQVLVSASNSLVDNSILVSRVYFPRLILPLAAAGPFLIDFAIAAVFLVGMLLFYGFSPGLSLAWLPVFTLLALLASLSVGVGLAAVNVRFRDVRYAVPFLVQFWLFASPVAYPTELIPEAWLPLFRLNPIVGVVDGFRWALFGVPRSPWPSIATAAAVTAVLFLVSLAYFSRTERQFADVI
ncbi:MAG: ABC transporter permease [Actinomycetota bacterium]